MGKDTLFDSREELIIPMERNQELVVAERAAELARSLGFAPDPVDEIRIAVIEAVINAIEHSGSPDRRVFITFGLRRSPPRLEIIVSDRGGGFDPSRVDKPDIHKKMVRGARKRGWGLQLMRSLMDEVRVQTSKEGSRVVLVKNGEK